MSARGRSGPIPRTLTTLGKIQRSLPVTIDELDREFSMQEKTLDFYLDIMSNQTLVLEARANGEQVADPAYPYVPMQKFLRIVSEWRLVVRAYEDALNLITNAVSNANIAAHNAAPHNTASNNDASSDDAASDSD